MTAMKTIFTLTVIMCIIASSSGTLKNLLKSKARTAALIQPTSRYRTVKYLTPVPVPYSSPVSTFSAHLSTYSTSSPSYSSVGVYGAPISSYSIPVAHVSTYRAPVTVHASPIPAFSGSAFLSYGTPEIGYIKNFPEFDEQILGDCNYVDTYEPYK